MPLRTQQESLFYWVGALQDPHIIQLYHQLELDSSKNSWQMIFNRYKLYVIIIAGLLALLLIHTVYIRFKIRQKTNEIHALYAVNEQKNKQIYAAQRVLLSGELAAGLAHEINQPLMAINNYIAGYQYRLQANSLSTQEIQTMLAQLKIPLHTIKNITLRVRNFCKRNEEVKECLSLSTLLKHCLAFCEYELKKQAILYEVQVSDEIFIVADRTLLQQVFINLLCNAIDAVKMSDKKRRYILIKADYMQENIHITFQDNGIGMSPTQQKRLFLPFNTTKPNGFGLGMVICKSVIEQANGEISVSSQLGEGTRINIILPRETQ